MKRGLKAVSLNPVADEPTLGLDEKRIESRGGCGAFALRPPLFVSMKRGLKGLMWTSASPTILSLDEKRIESAMIYRLPQLPETKSR
jgi:hypothetical protein